MKKNTSSVVHLGIALAMAMSMAFAASPADATAQDTQPLSAVLKTLEEKAYGIPAEAEFDNGHWKITVCNPDGCRRAFLDPRTGDVTRWRRPHHQYGLPPEGSLPLSAVAEIVESRGMGMIDEVEFDNGVWKFDLRKEGRRIRLHVDPATGEFRR